MLFEILLLCLSLSIDALGIGITYGIRGIKLPLIAKIIVALQSILITAIALFGGAILSRLLPSYLAKGIGVSILVIMGIWIIYQGITEKEEEEKTEKKEDTIFNLFIRSLGITIQIIRTPGYSDRDSSKIIEPGEAFYLGLALSIDSLGAGLGSGAAGLVCSAIPFLTALCQALFLSSGILFGKIVGTKINMKSNIWVIISGTLLILIGVLKLL